MDPNQKPTEPQRTSQPGETPMPVEAPQQPQTEYERNVPHEGNEPVARADAAGKGGEGSYEGTKQYDDGLDAFTKKHSVEQSIEEGKKIDLNDPALKAAEEKAKAPSKTDRKPAMPPDQGRVSSPSHH